MTTTPRARRYAGFFGSSLAIVVALCAVGWAPTRRLAGPDADAAMMAGCGIGLLSAALAGLLLVAAGGDDPQIRMQRAFMAMFVRLAVVIVLGIAAALSGLVARSPLLFWMATTYVALLPLEVRLAIS